MSIKEKNALALAVELVRQHARELKAMAIDIALDPSAPSLVRQHARELRAMAIDIALDPSATSSHSRATQRTLRRHERELRSLARDRGATCRR
jgi:hypothetical protein